MSFLTKINKLFGVTVLAILAVSTSTGISIFAQDFHYANTNSNVGIVPAHPGESPITRAWFVETIKAGETVEQTASLINNSDQPVPVIVVGKDSLQTPQGSYTFRENVDKDVQVGTWIEFTDTPKLTIPAKSSVDFHFKIKVPAGTVPGEYSGAIAVQQDKSEEERNGVQVLMRIGARIYITVPDDLHMNTSAHVFEFLTDSNEQYKMFLQRNATADFKNIYLNIGLANQGNIFTKISGVVKIVDPEGKEFTQIFNRELAGGTQVDPSWVNMQQTWKLGNYKAIYEWENSPLVSINKENVADKSSTKKMEISFEMTQEKMDNMAKIQEEADADKTLTNVAAPTGNLHNQNVVPQAAVQNSTATAQTDNTLLYGLIGGLAVIILAMGGGFGFFIYKNSKKEESENKAE